MSRTLLVLALVALPLAGCIQAPPDPDADAFREVAPPAQRIEGMTAEEKKQDKVESCTGGASIPPQPYCATRDLLVTGRIGVDELPLDLRSVNGRITVTAGPGDAWSFHAVVSVRGATEEEARRGLDTTWSWSHADGRSHFLQAGPAQGVPVGGAQFQGATYEVVLPAWVVLDGRLATTNGDLGVVGFRVRDLAFDTTNGGIAFVGAATTLRGETTNGGIEAALTPAASGSVSLRTTNGGIDLALVESRERGYDLAASTTNGRVTIDLRDGEVSGEPRDRRFQTHGYATRAIQTTVELETTNGRIAVAGQ